MKEITLLALESGKRKDGSGSWYRATLRSYNQNKQPIVGAFYLDQKVGEKAVKDGIIVDCPVKVTLDFDDYMRPVIVDLSKLLLTGTKA